MKCNVRLVKRIIFNIIFVAAVVCVFTQLEKIWTPSHTVIRCHDPDIMRPYHTSTVSHMVLAIVALPIPFAMMVILEWVCPPKSTQQLDKVSPIRKALVRALVYTRDNVVGTIFVTFLLIFIKIAVSEARPNFWDVCRPNVTEAQCDQGYVHVTWRDCTNPHQLSHRQVVDTMKSFPSGHSSSTVFISVFMIVYIHRRLWRACSYLLAPWLQLAWASWAVFCCQSRIWDNKHHWWDVLAGGVMGAFAALLTVHHLCRWFDRGERVQDCEALDDEAQTFPALDDEAQTSPASPTPSSTYLIPDSERRGHNIKPPQDNSD